MILKNGLNPENYKNHFEEIKKQIMNLEIQKFTEDKNNKIEHKDKDKQEIKDHVIRESI